MRLSLAAVLLVSLWAGDGHAAAEEAGQSPQQSAAKAPFPDIRRWNSLKITLSRGPCLGSCPAYTVEIDGDGTVTFDGQDFVAVPGRHRTRIAQDAVHGLFDAFRNADFLGLMDSYRAPITDLPTFSVGIAFDGVHKQVQDHVGEKVGMPVQAIALENEIDRVAGTEKWIAGNADTLPALQAEGWDLQSHYDKNLRLLSPSANFFDSRLIAQWLEAGVPADSGYGCRALTMAVSHHDLATAQLLITAHAPFVLEAGKDRSGLACDALGDAVERGDIDGAAWLLARGADVDQHDRSGTTLLMRAGQFSGIYKLLLSRGANVNARDVQGRTALMRAGAWPEMVRLLLEAGANPDLKDSQGKAALDFFGAGSPAAQALTGWRQEHGK
jgi:hypothetical protein